METMDLTLHDFDDMYELMNYHIDFISLFTQEDPALKWRRDAMVQMWKDGVAVSCHVCTIVQLAKGTKRHYKKNGNLNPPNCERQVCQTRQSGG